MRAAAAPHPDPKKTAPEGAVDRMRSIFGRSVTAAAATTTTEVATRGATIALLGFIDLQRTTAEVLAIESLHGARGIGARHFDEAEATGASGFAIVHQRHLFNGAMGGEVGTHLVFGGIERQISNVKFHPEELTIKRDGDRQTALSAVVREYFEVSTPVIAGVASTKNRQAGVDGTGFAAGTRLFRVEEVPMADRKSTRLNSSHVALSRMPSSVC